MPRYKEGRALRTETTINNTYDYNIGKKLSNLDELMKIGHKANQRLLDVQRLSHDCAIGIDSLNRVTKPVNHDGQYAPAFPFGNKRTMALMQAICLFCVLPNGFSNPNLRAYVAQLLGFSLDQYKPGKMTYDLRRLRIHGLIQRIPRTTRYTVTEFGLRTALFFTKTWNRIFRTGLSFMNNNYLRSQSDRHIKKLWRTVDLAIDDLIKLSQLNS